MTVSYLRNFDPSVYLGCDGSPPEMGSSDPWTSWCKGENDQVPQDFALFIWWQLVDLIETFVMWRGAGCQPLEYSGIVRRDQDIFRDQLVCSFQAISTIVDEAWLMQSFEFESEVNTSIVALSGDQPVKKTFVQCLCAHSIKCMDDGISGLLENNATKSSMAFVYAMRSLDLAHEYSTDPAAMGKRARVQLAKAGAAAKLAKDPKQEEKQFIFSCWQEWQLLKQQKKDTYRTKSAFAIAMIDKCVHLKRQKQVEDWCRTWEKEFNVDGRAC